MISLGFSVTPKTPYGVHGYDNAEPLMHAIFMAKGPLFQSGTVLPTFNSVDLFKLFCKILEINSTENDGVYRSDIWKDLLRPQTASIISKYGISTQTSNFEQIESAIRTLNRDCYQPRKGEWVSATVKAIRHLNQFQEIHFTFEIVSSHFSCKLR